MIYVYIQLVPIISKHNHFSGNYLYSSKRKVKMVLRDERFYSTKIDRTLYLH